LIPAPAAILPPFSRMNSVSLKARGGANPATIDLGSGGFLYLLGKFDGKNY
jgi:hypothetical protein